MHNIMKIVIGTQNTVMNVWGLSVTLAVEGSRSFGSIQTLLTNGCR